MDRNRHIRALEEHLQAQFALLQACARLGAPARDARPCPMWIDVFVRMSYAMAATGSAVARLQAAPQNCLRLPRLRLPKLPAQPDPGEHPPPPRKTAKQPEASFPAKPTV